jgi:Ca2+-binding RTX toxin-like protein
MPNPRRGNVGALGLRTPGRRFALLAVTLAAGLLGAPAAAHAVPHMSVSVTVGTPATVGQTLPASFTLTNDSAENTPLTLCRFGDAGACTGSQGIVVVPSCGQDVGPACSPTGADPGVFSVNQPVTGAAGTACAGASFAVTPLGDPQGRLRLTRTGDVDTVLAQGQSCRVEFTVTALKVPAIDARAQAAVQTVSIVTASARTTLGAPNDFVAGGGSTVVTVSPAPPAPPAVTGVDPASPAADNAPRVRGTAPAGTMVSLYANAGCTGLPLAQGSAATFAAPGIAVAVADNTTTTFHATAIDAQTDIESACSASSVTYVEDSAAPAAPSGLLVDPLSPANDNTPAVRGAASVGTTISVYANATCSGAPAAQGPAMTFALAGLTVGVADNSTTRFSATATKSTGVVSACSGASAAYVEDSIGPATAIASGPSGEISATGATFAFLSPEPAATFECRVDDGAFFGCVSPRRTGPLAAGAHTFEVRAIDRAGNADPTPAQRTFTVGGTFRASSLPGCSLTGNNLVGTADNDGLRGTSRTDVMIGLTGSDTLRGLGGRDCLLGQGGTDRLYGGSGADLLFGGTDNDSLYGDGGDDRLSGQAGLDRMDGGAGRDRLLGGSGSDRLTDRRGADSFAGGAGGDRIDARDRSLADRRTRDRISCGAGRDVVFADPRDSVARDCESVRKRSL